MNAPIRIRVGAALALAAVFVILGVGLNTDAKSGNRKMSVAVRADHPDASRALNTGVKSTFSVGVPVIVDEETVIYS